MTATNHHPDDPTAGDTTPRATVVDRVREAISTARANGTRPPGRPALIRLTGGTDYEVRRAMAVLANTPPPGYETDSPPKATTAAPRHRRQWPLLIIGLGAAVAVWSGWVGLGELTGFGDVRLLPGLVDTIHINTAVVLPLSVEAYGGYALRCWLGSVDLAHRTRTFARRSAIISLTIGAAAQVAYHLMIAAGTVHAPWPVTVLVSCIPVLVLGLASALAWLIATDTTQDSQPSRHANRTDPGECP